MRKAICSYCGLPFNALRVEVGAPAYCCTGCALASRLPTRGDAPVTPFLIISLVLGFVFFNQVLFWLMAFGLEHEARLNSAVLFSRLSKGVGAVVWISATWILMRNSARHWSDLLIIMLTLLVMASGLILSKTAVIVAGNAAILGWLARGWGKQKIRGKNINPI